MSDEKKPEATYRELVDRAELPFYIEGSRDDEGARNQFAPRADWAPNGDLLAIKSGKDAAKGRVIVALARTRNGEIEALAAYLTPELARGLADVLFRGADFVEKGLGFYSDIPVTWEDTIDVPDEPSEGGVH